MNRVLIDANEKGTFISVKMSDGPDPEWFTEKLPEGAIVHLDVTDEHVKFTVETPSEKEDDSTVS